MGGGRENWSSFVRNNFSRAIGRGGGLSDASDEWQMQGTSLDTGEGVWQMQGTFAGAGDPNEPWEMRGTPAE